MTSEFDAIDYVRELEAAGVPHVQATIHAKALTTAVAVIRGDLNAIARRLTGLITEVKEDQVESATTLRAQMMASEERLNDRIDAFLDEVAARFSRLEEKYDARFNALEEKSDARFNALEERSEARFNALEERSEARANGLEERLRLLELAVERISSTLTMMKWALGILAGSQVAMLGMMAKFLMP